MAIRLINGNEVFTSCTLMETGEQFFRTREGIFDKAGKSITKDERPDAWSLLMPNAIIIWPVRWVAV